MTPSQPMRNSANSSIRHASGFSKPPVAAHPAPAAGPSAVTRISRLDALLVAGRRVNLPELAEAWEVSPRTLKRDIERLRDQHRAPIAWHAGRRSYHYTAPYQFCEHLRLDADEALALALAGSTFAAWAGTPLGAALTAALGKIADFAGDRVSFPADSLAELLYQSEADIASADAEHRHFATLLDHIRAHRVLRLAYRKPDQGAAEPRLVHPFHLAYLDHRWMLVAHDVARRDWRNFLLARIEQLEPTGDSFTPPSRDAIRDRLRGSIGRFSGDADMEVRLQFDAVVARYVRERPWHHSQTLHDLPDGGFTATYRLNNLVDIERRILACGGHARVLAPPELAAAIQAAARRLLAPHAAPTEIP